ncbi:hybrid sensor histidine kinase/response regulator [Melittangium boletus]|uniref:histidine kinase n=1 Tax=Melittangium boletus DSM 14713 TaxID=1294270 RepID=A0A250IR46_9BACT|nr:PAS domain S-box protein [Melittangium boletus]ATB33657.1 histidine kinase [Melittangium boletus DSM 14713]
MEQWAHRFFDLSTDLLAVLDTEGRILQVNPAWCGAVGWTREALMDGVCWRFVHPEELESLKARLRALRGTDTPVRFSCRWRCASGAWTRLSWCVVPSAPEGRLYCTVRPAPAAAEAAESVGLTSLWSLSDGLPFGLYLVESHSGRVLYANHRFRQMGGLDTLEDALRRGEVTHARVLEWTRGSSLEPALVHIDSRVDTEPSTSDVDVLEVSLSNGRILRRLATPMRDVRGVSPCQLYIFEDVTDTRRTEEALQRSATNFRKLTECLPDGLFVHRDRRFVYVNPMLCTSLGYAHPEELIGQPIWCIVHPDDLPLVRQRVTTAVSGGVAPVQEIRYLRKDGSSYDAESTGLSLEFDGQEAVVVIARDITERKRMQAQLLQTDRMALVGTLAAGMGHEINNPLSYVLTNIRLALENTQRLKEPGSEREHADNLQETEDMLREAHEGGLRVRDIVRDLKLFSRQTEEENKAEVDVLKPLEFSLKMAQGELRHRAQLVKRYEPVPRVFADESRLGQVFLNLLMNAAQAIPEGDAAHHEISVWVRPGPSGGVAIDVRDTGVGIAPELLERIFEPFFTTKPVGMGTGLGLSICHGILRDLGGELSVRSKPGRGSTFTLHLPAAAPASVPSRRPPSRILPAVGQGRLLIIDDEPAVARSLARLIGPRHQVTLAGSGLEGLARLNGQEPFDVIFCDLMMPDATGMDVYEQVREARPELARRFIFITGGSFTPRARRFLESVPERWLEKPFDEQRLHRLINEVLRST